MLPTGDIGDRCAEIRQVWRRPQTFSFPTGLFPRTLGPINDVTLLNGWIRLHGVLDHAGS